MPVNVSGKVTLFRAASARSDVTQSFTITDQNEYLLSTDELLNGRWKVIVEWEDDLRVVACLTQKALCLT